MPQNEHIEASSRSGAHTLASTRSPSSASDRARASPRFRIHAAPRPVFRLDTAAAAKQPRFRRSLPPSPPLADSRPPAGLLEKKRKKEAREPHKRSAVAKKLIGLKAKLYAKKRHAEKVTMKKTIQQHSERTNKSQGLRRRSAGRRLSSRTSSTASRRADRRFSNTIKQKRGMAAQGAAPVRPMAPDEMFRVMRSGKRQKNNETMMPDATFVGPGFTRKPPKHDLFDEAERISSFTSRRTSTHHQGLHRPRPDHLRREEEPQRADVLSLGVLTKGTVIEVNVSEPGSSFQE